MISIVEVIEMRPELMQQAMSGSSVPEGRIVRPDIKVDKKPLHQRMSERMKRQMHQSGTATREKMKQQQRARLMG